MKAIIFSLLLALAYPVLAEDATTGATTGTTRPTTIQQRIDTRRENQKLADAGEGKPHILDLPPEVLTSKMKKSERLNPEQARQLDKKRR